jgi:phosphatidylserine/phosphatidylglycerophosphate/cardiolipin synthase-like enzyme
MATSVNAIDYFNIQERIQAKNYYKRNFEVLFGNKDYSDAKKFKEIIHALDKKKKESVLNFIKTVDINFSPKVLRPLVYWRFIKPNKDKVATTLAFHMYHKQLILRDYINSPSITSDNKHKAQNLIIEINSNKKANDKNVQKLLLPDFQDKAKHMAAIKSDDALIRAIKETKIISLNLQDHIPSLPFYSLSYMGIIPGNKVEVISKSDQSIKRIEWLLERRIKKGEKINFDAKHIKMPTKKDVNGHLVFQQDPIFIKIKDLISEAKHSIFINTYLLGGSLGATLSEYLLDQTAEKLKTNPNFKLLILHGLAKDESLKEESLPIIDYINQRISNNNVLSSSAYIFRNDLNQKNKDHSKLIIIDANTNTPQAYFGSKDWTDHNGAYFYDDAIWVKGPAAALAQAAYYDDIKAIINTSKNLSQSKKSSIIEEFKVKKSEYPYIGKDSIRLTEVDHHRKVKNVRNILIDMIKHANKSIYMEHHFFYDTYVVNALIKRKVEVPQLDVKLILDHNASIHLNGLPNTIHMSNMIKNGIKIRTRKSIIKKGNDKFKFDLSSINHRRITSIDGEMILGGSANITPDTLQGNYRQFGAQIWSKKEASKFDERFLNAFNNKNETLILDIENFEAKIGNKKLSKRISAIINGLGAFLFGNKDKLERRN